MAHAGQAVLGEGTAAAKDGLKETLHELKQGQPDTVLPTRREMHAEVSARGADWAADTIHKGFTYREKRRTHIE